MDLHGLLQGQPYFSPFCLDYFSVCPLKDSCWYRSERKTVLATLGTGTSTSDSFNTDEALFLCAERNDITVLEEEELCCPLGYSAGSQWSDVAEGHITSIFSVQE
jgi:hypothetical protein